MLNGGTGDFCYQSRNVNDNEGDIYSRSWSCNTKNYILVGDQNVEVFNWSTKELEVIPGKMISSNMAKFYEYLVSRSFRSSKDVVPFVIDLFKQLRNLTLERTNPVEALNLLFVLLTSLEDDFARLDAKKWGISFSHVPPGFEEYVTRLRNGVGKINPKLDLILRHTSGALFQEAQKEALFFDVQRDLFGGTSGRLETRSALYSSIHYTPPYLSRTIVEQALKQLDLNQGEIKIFDPACGASEFLIEALKQLREANYSGQVKVYGWDSSETAISTSQFLLRYEQRTLWGEDKLQYELRKVDDSLTEDWLEGIDLVLMNPPFVSWELLSDKKSKEAVRESLGASFNGKPNQASAFFVKAIASMREGSGVIGCVIPSSLLNFESYKLVRSRVLDMVSINLIGKLGNFVFEDALTDVSLIIAKRQNEAAHLPHILWTRNEKGVIQPALRDLRKMLFTNEPIVKKLEHNIYKPATFPVIQDSWKPLASRDYDLFKLVERFVVDQRLVRVGQVFNVRQGIRQGAKNVFKLSASDYERIPTAEKRYFRPVVDNSSIKQGQLFKNMYIWYPYNSDGVIFKEEQELRKQAKSFYEAHLEPNRDLLSKRAGLTGGWWTLTRPRNWQYEKKPKLVSTEFGKSDSFGFDQFGSFVVERGNAWIPKKEFNLQDFHFYLALFSSNLFNRLLSIYSKQLAGGKWYDLGKKYTKNIPIPDVNSSVVRESGAYLKLVEIGRELCSGNNYTIVMADDILESYFYPTI